MNSIVTVCEPVFTYLCVFAKKYDQSNFNYDRVRGNIEDLIDDIRAQLVFGSGLWRQYSMIEKPLYFFIDSVICEFDLDVSKEWNIKRMAYKFGIMTGDKKFFDIFDDFLGDYSVDADECLKFYYYCLQLGFTGIYRDNSKKIKYYLDRITERVPSLVEMPEDFIRGMAFNGLDNRYLLVGSWLKGSIFLYLVLMVFIIAFAVNLCLYFAAVYPLLKEFKFIIK